MNSAPGASSPGQARLVERRDLSPTLAVFRFEPQEGVPDFRPGQFIVLGIRLGSGRVLWRPYSISSPPEERRTFELYIRLVQEPPDRMHLTPLLWEMSTGQRLFWKGPKGTFGIAEEHPDGEPDERRLLLIAGGTGIAPFVSCVLHRKTMSSSRPIVLCHGARHVDELGYRDLMLDLERRSLDDAEGRWNFHYLPTISRPRDSENEGWSGHVGRVGTLLVKSPEENHSPVEQATGGSVDPDTTCAYVCGFDGTVAAALSVLEPLGFRTRKHPRPDGRYDVHCESYG